MLAVPLTKSVEIMSAMGRKRTLAPGRVERLEVAESGMSAFERHVQYRSLV